MGTRKIHVGVRTIPNNRPKRLEIGEPRMGIDYIQARKALHQPPIIALPSETHMEDQRKPHLLGALAISSKSFRGYLCQ